MGRPKKETLASELLGDDEPTREEMDLDEFLEDLGGGVAIIHILRIRPDGGMPQVGKATMDDLREDPYEYIRQNYGAGKFRLIFKGSNRRIQAVRQIELEAAKGTNGAPAPASGMSSIFPPDMSFQDKLLMMRFMIPEKPAIDIGSVMAGIAGMMTAMRPADPAKPQDPVEMFRTCVTMFESLKDKNAKPPLEQLREVASVIREFSGDKDTGAAIDSPWGMVTEIGKQVVSTVGPALAGLVPGAPRPAIVQQAPRPAPAPAALAPGSRQPSDTGNLPAPATPNAEENLQRWLVAQISFFKEKAKAGKDPGFWIDYVFENAEEPGCQAFMYALRRGATYENLLEFDTEIAQNPQLSLWFKEVFEGVRTGLLQENVDSGRAGGDSSNVVPNVPSSATGQPNGAGPGSSTVVP